MPNDNRDEQPADMPNGHGFEIVKLAVSLFATVLLGLVGYVFVSAIGRLEAALVRTDTTAERNAGRLGAIEVENSRIREAILNLADRIKNEEIENQRQWSVIAPYTRGKNVP